MSELGSKHLALIIPGPGQTSACRGTTEQVTSCGALSLDRRLVQNTVSEST